MSEEQGHLPYHRRMRPVRIKDYVGNEKIKKSAMKALRGDKKPQVILMQGTAGCGKTTFARLLAKEYLCENRDPDEGACGECFSCQSMVEYIENGDSANLYNVREVDVTDSNKKEDMNEILEDMSSPSYDGSWKIYILDEVHMMSNAGQNRLLKTLEEPYEKVLIILCTTDPDKLLGTIISRCQYTFKVSKPTRAELCGLLATVCRKEGVKFEPRALSLVCVKGEFVPRKTLIALEQVVREANAVTYQSVIETLNVVADLYFFEFYRYLLRKNIDTLGYISFMGRVKMEMDLKSFIDNLLAFTMRGIYIINGVPVEALDPSEIKQYKELFSQFGAMELITILNQLLDMKNSKDVEAKLLLLGYTGIHSNNMVATNSTVDDLQVVPMLDNDVGKENHKGEESFKESITITESEKEDLINSNMKTVSMDDFLAVMGGTKITL